MRPQKMEFHLRARILFILSERRKRGLKRPSSCESRIIEKEKKDTWTDKDSTGKQPFPQGKVCFVDRDIWIPRSLTIASPTWNLAHPLFSSSNPYRSIRLFLSNVPSRDTNWCQKFIRSVIYQIISISSMFLSITNDFIIKPLWSEYYWLFFFW